MENDGVPEFSLLRDSINDSQVRSCMSVTPVQEAEVGGILESTRSSIFGVCSKTKSQQHLYVYVCVSCYHIYTYITYIA